MPFDQYHLLNLFQKPQHENYHTFTGDKANQAV